MRAEEDPIQKPHGARVQPRRYFVEEWLIDDLVSSGTKIASQTKVK
jgi:hypothetical protein